MYPKENEMPIGPDEVEIIGSWVMVNGRLTEDDAARRITSLVETELKHIATTQDGWEKLYLDPQDGRFWELTYPRGEMQGGGPQALLLARPQKVQEKYGVSIDQ
jgi:hypothetical protein